jgi:Secretion system C-terminal sorting domain
MQSKKLPLLFYALFLICGGVFAQISYPKIWDYKYGGTDWEQLTCFQLTPDSGYILGGYSLSGISGNKSQPCVGGFDYWIIKLDSLGNKQWDKTYGGTDIDALTSLHQTNDGGYILGGYSSSGIGGDKSEANVDTLSPFTYDYWFIKIDSLGNKQWDKTFGGTNNDYPRSLKQTADGGYIVGGYSNSNLSGDKSQNTFGLEDYWVLKLDTAGNKQWDKSYGGTSYDYLYDLHQTSDGGFLMGGLSKSGTTGNKTHASFGNEDFWVVKTDALGNKIWDSDYGGTSYDALFSLVETNDGGYMLGGLSASPPSGNKSHPSWGGNDYWIVKITPAGVKQWDKAFGGDLHEDDFGNVSLTNDGGYLVSGVSYSDSSGNKTEDNLGMEQPWIIKTDSSGIKQWDKTIFTPGHEEFGLAYQTINGCYTVASYIRLGTGGYVTQANFDSINNSPDFWLVRFCDSTLTTDITPTLNSRNEQGVQLYPNPATSQINVTSPHIITHLKISNTLGQLVYETIPHKKNVLVTPFKDGIYFVAVTTGNSLISKKVIIKN